MLGRLLLSVAILSSGLSYGSTYVAMGDSISVGTNAEPGPAGSEYSWAVGEKLQRNFTSALGHDLDKHYNVAIPGAFSSLLQLQAGVVEFVQANYVTITIGGNDFAWARGQDVLPNIRSILTRLSAHDYVQRILVSTVPDLEQIYELGKPDPKCQLFHVFAPLFLLAPQDYRMRVAQQIHDTNEQIKALTAEFPKLTVVDAASTRTYKRDDISQVDCIHPSKVGQQQIADAFIEAFRSAQ